MEIRTKEPLAQALTSAIDTGDIEALRQLLDGDPQISKARIVDPKCSTLRPTGLATSRRSRGRSGSSSNGVRARMPRWWVVTRRKASPLGRE
jgi:hypothetical protein